MLTCSRFFLPAIPARPSEISRQRCRGSAYSWRTACTGHTQAAQRLQPNSTTPHGPRTGRRIPHPPGPPTMAGRRRPPTPTSVPYGVSQPLALSGHVGLDTALSPLLTTWSSVHSYAYPPPHTLIYGRDAHMPRSSVEAASKTSSSDVISLFHVASKSTERLSGEPNGTEPAGPRGRRRARSSSVPRDVPRLFLSKWPETCDWFLRVPSQHRGSVVGELK